MASVSFSSSPISQDPRGWAVLEHWSLSTSSPHSEDRIFLYHAFYMPVVRKGADQGGLGDSVWLVVIRSLLLPLQEEKAAHAKTKVLLAKEEEKLQFALGEVEVLSKQLEKEKLAFEKA